MNTNSMMGLLDVIVICAGAYLFYGWYLLMFRNEIKEGLVISKASSAKKCKDIEGYKRLMGPKLLIFALVAVGQGAVSLINTYVTPVPAPVFWTVYALFFVVLIWFVMGSRKAEKEYF